MQQIKALIVDDEALARVNIRAALQGFSNWLVVGELHHGKELTRVCDVTQPDVVFLDIQMPGDNGMTLAETMMQGARPPLIVFVTAYDAFAVDAFELQAFDYLLKPFDDERFAQTIKRVEAQLSLPDSALRHWQLSQLQGREKLDQLVIRSIGSIKIIPLVDVIRFQSCGNYVEVHHKEGMDLHRVSLNHLETRLDAAEFARVHRSSVVKLNQIKELKTIDDHHHLILANGDEVKISPAYKGRLFERMGI